MRKIKYLISVILFIFIIQYCVLAGQNRDTSSYADDDTGTVDAGGGNTGTSNSSASASGDTGWSSVASSGTVNSVNEITGNYAWIGGYRLKIYDGKGNLTKIWKNGKSFIDIYPTEV